MLISAPVFFTHEGKPANMYVLRNDGFCWGRIVFEDKETAQLDVDPPDNVDLYDDPDVDAAERLIELARIPKHVVAVVGAPL